MLRRGLCYARRTRSIEVSQRIIGMSVWLLRRQVMDGENDLIQLFYQFPRFVICPDGPVRITLNIPVSRIVCQRVYALLDYPCRRFLAVWTHAHFLTACFSAAVMRESILFT